MTPWRTGQTGLMFTGVRPNMSRASAPMASIPAVRRVERNDRGFVQRDGAAREEHVFAVPRSMATSEEAENIPMTSSVKQFRFQTSSWQLKLRHPLFSTVREGRGEGRRENTDSARTSRFLTRTHGCGPYRRAWPMVLIQVVRLPRSRFGDTYFASVVGSHVNGHAKGVA